MFANCCWSEGVSTTYSDQSRPQAMMSKNRDHNAEAASSTTLFSRSCRLCTCCCASSAGIGCSFRRLTSKTALQAGTGARSEKVWLFGSMQLSASSLEGTEHSRSACFTATAQAPWAARQNCRSSVCRVACKWSGANSAVVSQALLSITEVMPLWSTNARASVLKERSKLWTRGECISTTVELCHHLQELIELPQASGMPWRSSHDNERWTVGIS